MVLLEDWRDADRVWATYRQTGDLMTLREEFLTNSIITNVPDEYDDFVHAALQDGDVAAADLLIELGLLDVQRPADDSYHYLHFAIEECKGGLTIIEFLVDRGADIEQWGVNGWTPLHIAAIRGRVEAAELLLDRGADINARTRSDGGLTPLMEAAWAGQLEIVRLLVKRRADRHLRNDWGETAADRAARNSHHEVARFLQEWKGK